MSETQWVEVGWHGGLGQALAALGVSYRVSGPGLGMMDVRMDAAADGALEELVGRISELRWRYEQGRVLQLEMDLGGVGG